jgi:hypothetical protein
MTTSQSATWPVSNSSALECGDLDRMAVVKQFKIIPLEIFAGKSSFHIEGDDIDQDQG